jgi:hypothetical protein
MPKGEFEDRHNRTLAERNALAYRLIQLQQDVEEVKERIRIDDALLVANNMARQDWEAEKALEVAAAQEVKNDATV